MQNLPIFIQLKNKPVLVVGGGEVALRKVQTLLKVQAKVTVISLAFCPEISAIKDDNLHLQQGEFSADLLTAKWLVIAATDNNKLNQEIHDLAVAEKIWVNVVDNPPLCQFIFPAIIDRSPIVMAISSSGEAPVLARLWKERFESLLPQWTGKLASLAGSYRQQVKQQIKSFTDRRHFWERFFRGDIAALAAQNDWQGVRDTINNTLTGDNTLAGKCFYVNYGDGEPDNLTLKALQSMQLADVIYFNVETPEPILELCRKDASKIQIDLNTVTKQIEQDIRQGKIVCRLVKGTSEVLQLAKQEADCLNIESTWVHGLIH